MDERNAFAKHRKPFILDVSDGAAIGGNLFHCEVSVARLARETVGWPRIPVGRGECFLGSPSVLRKLSSFYPSDYRPPRGYPPRGYLSIHKRRPDFSHRIIDPRLLLARLSTLRLSGFPETKKLDAVVQGPHPADTFGNRLFLFLLPFSCHFSVCCLLGYCKNDFCSCLSFKIEIYKTEIL